MRFLFGYIFCCLSSFGVCAQTSQLDSLKTSLEGKKGDDRLIKLYEMAVRVQNIDIPMINLCADEALKIIPELSNSLKIKAYKMKAFALYFSGKEIEALSFLLKGLEISRKIKSDRETGYLLNFYSVICISKGEYGKALESIFEAISFENLENKELRPRYSNIGLIYYKVQNTQKSIDYYKRALSVSNPEDFGYGILLINIGLSYFQINEYSIAFDYVNRGLESCENNCDRIRIQGDLALGVGNYLTKELGASEDYLNTSLLLSTKTNDLRFISENLVLLAKIYLETDRLDLAAETLWKAEENSRDHDLNELLLATYHSFITLYKIHNNFEELSNYYVKYNALLEKLHGSELLQQISVFQVEMEHEANLQTMAHQKQVLDLQDNSLRQQRRIYFGISVLIVLIVFILLLLWRRNVQGLKIKALLEQRVMHRTEYLSRKKQILEDSNDFLTRYTDERFKKIIRLILRFEHGGVYRYEHYKSQLEPTIVRMKVISESVLLLRGASLRKDYPDTTKRTLLGSLT